MTNVDAARLDGVYHGEAASRADSAYSIIRYNSDADSNGSRDRDQTFEIPGDHVHVLELNGSDVIGIATGQRERGFIPLHEGQTYKRPFDRFTIRNFSRRPLTQTVGGDAGGPTTALLLVSRGEVIEVGHKPKGFFAGFPVWQGDATVDGVDVFANIPFSGNAITSPRVVNPLRFGGTLKVKNLDGANALWLYYGTPGNFRVAPDTITFYSAEHAWRLDAGQEITLEAEASLRRVIGATLGTVCVASTAGTVRFCAMISRYAQDFTDPDETFPDSTNVVLVP